MRKNPSYVFLTMRRIYSFKFLGTVGDSHKVKCMKFIKVDLTNHLLSIEKCNAFVERYLRTPLYYPAFLKITVYSDTINWSYVTPFSDFVTKRILLSNLTFNLNARGFQRTFATASAWKQRTLTPPDTWSCPTLRRVCGLMISEFGVSNIPWY